jgi:potassium-transporting ATPase potassium-binding subunit
MLFGRCIIIISALAIAGSLVQKKINPLIARFPTTGSLFVFVLVTVVLINGALTFFPVLVLGSVLEHLSILAGKTF